MCGEVSPTDTASAPAEDMGSIEMASTLRTHPSPRDAAPAPAPSWQVRRAAETGGRCGSPARAMAASIWSATRRGIPGTRADGWRCADTRCWRRYWSGRRVRRVQAASRCAGSTPMPVTQRGDARVNIAGRGCWPGWSPGCGAGEDHGEADAVKRHDADAPRSSRSASTGRLAIAHRLSRGRRDATVRTSCVASDSLGREPSHPRVRAPGRRSRWETQCR